MFHTKTWNFSVHETAPEKRTLDLSSRKSSVQFKSVRELQDHVDKLHSNQYAHMRHGNCKCCKKHKNHNWPEKRILQLNKIQPLALDSRLLTRIAYPSSRRKHHADSIKHVSSVKTIELNKKHGLIVPIPSRSQRKEAINALINANRYV